MRNTKTYVATRSAVAAAKSTLGEGVELVGEAVSDAATTVGDFFVGLYDGLFDEEVKALPAPRVTDMRHVDWARWQK